MRIMLDTNILISMIIFPRQMFLEMLDVITKHNKMVLSSYVLEELVDVVAKKFPKREEALKKFLEAIPYEEFITPSNIDPDVFKIRDTKDYPVLYSAILARADVLITGDKDILTVENIDPLKIMTAREFVERFAGSRYKL